ncbi:AarF/ABC1/UbiB kinase family protein [Formicincola oecophyllae]|uniref:AarF/ABC1/UbiB kinase family protein n=1 Tax=Formicincola oecophyllae TaxID=2558361 RepID=A0A4Y6UCR3_9PROT|nr:AarF/UbiB family protein [Formicincola oecophyllae]QDH13905.1 AarF/ABC1/UbiB kinase family protein [Formicincola oecophyllae]
MSDHHKPAPTPTPSRDKLDESGFLDGMGRLLRSSGAMGGVVARLAGQRLGFETGGAAHAEALKNALGGLKGPLMKGAQLLAAVPGLLPEEYADTLAGLQSNAPPMGWGFVARRMKAELGPEWGRHFSAFGRTAVAAASLGQVHKARLPDGRLVACKLQYPGMDSAVETDLGQLRALLGVYRSFSTTIRQDEVYAELAERMREELDYQREAANLRLYQHMLGTSAQVRVPNPVDDLTTKRLLVMEWVEGSPVGAAFTPDMAQEGRNQVASALFKAWYKPFYHYGVIHGDPHPGNFTLRAGEGGEGPGINLLDLGAIRVFRPRFVHGVVELYRALQEQDGERAYHAYELWGFKGLSRETAAILGEWARFFFKPLLTDRAVTMRESNNPEAARAMLEQVFEGLKRTGGVTLPREFVMLDRSAIGLGSAFLRLDAKLNWHRMFEGLLEGYSLAALERQQAAALQQAGVPGPDAPTA